MDKIIINGLKLYAYHGVNPEEKEDGQFFVLDITCFLDLQKPCHSDNVEDTVSYAQVIKKVRAAFLQEKYDLLEKAAQVVADTVLENFPAVESVNVLLKKPQAPVKADIAYTAVEITRNRV